jgi:hypothetical protein
MPEDSPVLPASRIVRWITLGALIVFAVGLYFREGRTLAPLTAPPPPPAAPADQPRN